jgi:CRISPR-associated protein Cas2
MAKRIHHIVVSYDIHDEKRLSKIGNFMKDYGERVLKSVFECNLSDAMFFEMKHRVEKLIDHMEDSVRYYFLCDKCLKNMELSGQGVKFKKDEPYTIT